MSTTEKLSITLPRDMAKMIRDKVGSGAYASNSEVIREALRLLQDQERVRAQKLKVLQEKVSDAIETGGPSLPADEVFDRLDERHRRRSSKT